jgi:hypothetical protein
MNPREELIVDGFAQLLLHEASESMHDCVGIVDVDTAGIFCALLEEGKWGGPMVVGAQKEMVAQPLDMESSISKLNYTIQYHS